MILVVADTSPLNYLVQIGCVDVLPGLYDRIMIPREVKAELAHARTPPVVEAWLRGNPKWLEVCELQGLQSAVLGGLDAGEAAAIQLARQEHADLLLIDERKGARIAQLQGLEVTGTLGVLLQGARRGCWISTPHWLLCSRPISGTHRNCLLRCGGRWRRVYEQRPRAA